MITQCDAVISLVDSDYFTRAWCCVEAMMIQSLVRYGIHTSRRPAWEWWEHHPSVDALDGSSSLVDGPSQPVAAAGAEGMAISESVSSKVSAPTDAEVGSYGIATETGTGCVVVGEEGDATESATGRSIWQLRKPKYCNLQMKDKALTYESDRPKVMFLSRQSHLLVAR